MIPSAFENVKRLPDDQLARVVQAARQGDMTAIEALNLTSATPVLAEMMRRNRIRETLQKNMMAGAPDPQTVLDKQLAQAQATQGIGDLEIPGMMEEQTYAHGGIVSFNSGGTAAQQSDNILYTPEMYGDAPAAPQEGGPKELSPEEFAKLSPQKQREYRDERIRQRYAAERAALGSAPKEMTPDEQREEYKKNLELARQTSEPYLKRMQELLAQAKPDEAKIGQDATKRAINTGLLSLIGAKRMPGESRMSSFASNVGEALRTGAGTYEKSVGNIDRLKREYMQSELKFVEAQNAAARGDAQSARDLANQATNDRKNAFRAYTGGLRDLGRREIEELENSFNLTAAEIRAATQAAETARKEKEDRDEARARDRRIELLAGRGSGGGDSRAVTAINNIARQIQADDKQMRTLRAQVAQENPGASPAELAAALLDKVDSLATVAYHRRRTLSRDGVPKPGEKPPAGSPTRPTTPGTIDIDPSGNATYR